ncbi:AMP-binding protein [Pseudovibrio ascidiaceicola]|uniref:AMP-binding protein n=1 Tax=Pseudovibrio ascidiaceicola TaxID=285279 RepID=UPI003D36CCF8
MFSAILNAIQTHMMQTPSAPALVNLCGVTSFGELGSRVQGILHALASSPDGTQLIVGHKEPDCVAAMLACALTERPFTFADRSLSAERISKIAQVTKATYVLEAMEGDNPIDLPSIQLSRVPSSPLSETEPLGNDDVVLYIIFTSGSSGEPKGVPISRHNFAALDGWYTPMLSENQPTGAHVNHSNLAFDMGMFDLWPALSLGKPIIMLDHANNIKPRNNLLHLLSCPAAPVSSWASTPSLLQLMCLEPKFNHAHLPQLGWFVIGGEMVPHSLLRDLQCRFPEAKLMNGYGPSEATCCTHLHQLVAADAVEGAPMPLGAIIPPSGMRILGPDGLEVPVGELGEIELSGPQVIEHYLPEDHPANVAIGWHNNQRTYRTGDLGRLNEKGDLTILGRTDRQIKLHGNRIELDEIERAADGFPPIQKSACIPSRLNGIINGIVLFVQPKSGADVSRSEIIAHLSRFLLSAAVPRDIRFVDDIPLTMNGKVDNRSLAPLTELQPEPVTA